MRICQVLASWESGGLEKHVIELSNELAKSHEVHVLVHPDMARHFSAQVTVHTIGFAGSRWSPVLLLRLALIIRRINPDIVHAQASKAASMLAFLRRFLPGKLVGTLHNQKKNVSMFTHMDHVIAVSPGIAKQLRGVPVTAVYNGIVPPPATTKGRDWLAQEFALDASRPVLVSVGRLVTAKGFDVLVSAAVQADVQVLIIGGGELENELREQIRREGAPVVLAGFRSDVQVLMGAADGYILSSRREGFAYVVVEALLSGLPMIATRIPMMEGVLPEGLMVDVEDADALARQMAEKAANLAAWREDMRETFVFAKKNLTLSGMVENTVMVYQRVLTI